MRSWWKRMTFMAAVAALSSCGGGGSGGASSTSASGGPAGATTEFPLDSAFKAMLVAGVTKTWTVSGSQCGTASEHDGPSGAASGTFGGNTAIASYSESINATLADCSTAAPFTAAAPAAATDLLYLGSTPELNYWKVGTTSATPTYGEFLVTYQAPVVYVGTTGGLGREDWYLGSSAGGTADGHTDFSFSVSADGSSNSSAIVDLISKRYDASNALLYTNQAYYRIAATGPLVPIKIDVQYSAASGSTDHLIFQ